MHLAQGNGFQRQDSWGLYDLSIYLKRDREARMQYISECIESAMTLRLLRFLPSVRSIKNEAIYDPSLSYRHTS
jgi:hypothetical protein